MGIDILDLKNVALTTDYTLNHLGFTNMQIAKANNICLLSAQGYFALAMLMRTEKAKQIRKELRRE